MRGIEARLRAAAQRPTAPSGGRFCGHIKPMITQIYLAGIKRDPHSLLRPPGGRAPRGTSAGRPTSATGHALPIPRQHDPA